MPTKKEELLEEQTKKIVGQERDPRTKFIKKDDVIAIIDRVIKNSANLLSYATIRSAEARAMLNGIKDAISKL